jgi:hypothetical protein
MAGYFSDNLYDAPKREQAEWWRRRAVHLQKDAQRTSVAIREAIAMAEKLDREAETE